MPLNLLKIYNQRLDIAGMNDNQRTQSLRGVFNRDIENNMMFRFKGKQINPTKGSEEPTERLFHHLTTGVIDEKTKKREFEIRRSERLHWLRHHIEERKQEGMLVFSVKEPDGIRTYILDEPENYVIVLEPYRDKTEYYLLTAYYLDGRNPEKMRRKYGRKLADLI